MPPDEVTPYQLASALCRACVEGKMTRSPFPVSTSKTAVEKLPHEDITGPFAPSVGGARFLMMMY